MATAMILIIVAGLLFVGIQLVGLGLRIALSRPTMYAAAHKLTQTTKAAANGDLNSLHSGTRDYRVVGGIAIKNGQWIVQGRVSDDVINGVLK